jgi:signal transduction histidine kinase
MNAPADASVSQTKLPETLVWAVVVICVLPFCLSLAGVDFGARTTLFDASWFEGRTPREVEDTLHRLLRGSFTHTVFEWSAFCTALFTVSLAFVHFNIRRDITTLVIGVALFFAGAMDAFHVLAADSLVAAVADRDNFLPMTWALGRLFNALIMMLGAGWVLLTRRSTWQGTSGVTVLVSLAFGGLTYLLISYSASRPTLPQTMFPDAVVTRPYDATALVMFLLAGVFIYPRLYQRVPSFFSHALIISTIPNVATQLHTTFGSTTLFDAHFNIAHFLKIIAYLVPFSGLMLDYIHTYREEARAVHYLTEARTSLLEHSQRLEQANADLRLRNTELDEFNYVASHDLQEPVRKLVVFSEHLRRDLGANLPSRAARDVDFIVDAATRMQALIQELLALSQAGRMAMQYEWVSLNACADRALEGLTMRLQDTHATVTRDALPTIWGDPTLLTQVYQNLIDNALKFVHDQPPAVHLTAVQEASRWVFGVRDNGIGVKRDFAERIFVPFQRLHNRTDYPGTGIGLSICRKAVERHGGRIWVESQPGQGAHFKFTLDTTTGVRWQGGSRIAYGDTQTR